MQIKSNQTLFDQPILKIRTVIRHAMAERLRGPNRDAVVEEVAKILGEPTSVSKRVFNSLVEEDYLEIKREKVAASYCVFVTETEKGRRLGVTRVNPPITREKASLLLTELLERVKTVNNNPEFIYRVETVKIFGSYLSDQELLGDIDVAVKLCRKVEGDEFTKRRDERIKLALRSGRTFSNFIDQLYWPHREVWLALTSRKKGLSLHDEDSDEILKKTEFEIVYNYNDQSQKV
jgi:predicted nucleotidyltransferase